MSDKTDPFDSPEGRRWAKAVQDDLVPKLADSAVSLTVWTGQVDAKIAVELGAAILLDKPIIIGVSPGVVVPEHLVRCADKIIELDITNPAKASASIRSALSTFGLA